MEHILVLWILYLYYEAYSCISDLIRVLRNLYLSYGTYTCVTKLILVFQILYLYYGAYTCITNLILVLWSLFLYFGYGSTRRYYKTFYLYKSTRRYYRTDTKVPVGTFRFLPYSFLYSYPLFRVLIHTRSYQTYADTDISP